MRGRVLGQPSDWFCEGRLCQCHWRMLALHLQPVGRWTHDTGTLSTSQTYAELTRYSLPVWNIFWDISNFISKNIHLFNFSTDYQGFQRECFAYWNLNKQMKTRIWSKISEIFASFLYWCTEGSATSSYSNL